MSLNSGMKPFNTYRTYTEFRQRNSWTLVLAVSVSALTCLSMFVCSIACIFSFASKVPKWCRKLPVSTGLLVWVECRTCLGCLCSFRRFVCPYSSRFPLNPVIPLIIFLIVFSSLWCIFILMLPNVCLAPSSILCIIPPILSQDSWRCLVIPFEQLSCWNYVPF